MCVIRCDISICFYFYFYLFCCCYSDRNLILRRHIRTFKNACVCVRLNVCVRLSSLSFCFEMAFITAYN